jgi:hypothetical protein
MDDARNLIFAYDPGGTSGFVCIKHTSGREFQFIAAYEIPWNDRLKIFNVIYANRIHIKTIIVERFRLFKNEVTLHSQIGSEMPAPRIISIIELSAALCKLDCLIFQEPGDQNNVSILPEHKKLIPYSLKYPTQRSEHCKDAYRHGRFYILTVARKGVK